MESIERSEDDSALKSIIDMAESCPKFLRPQLEQLFAACIKVFSDTNQEDAWRHLALEVIVTLCETAPAMVRKVAGSQIPVAIQVGRYLESASLRLPLCVMEQKPVTFNTIREILLAVFPS